MIELLRRAIGLALFGAHLIRRRAWQPPRRDSVSLQQRLTALPMRGLPLGSTVIVHWNAHQVPFIEAESDADLAVVLGAVHVHLRWAQMEVLRRISRGRIAELIGPLGAEVDHLLRAVDFARAVPRIVQKMPAETGEWITAFVAGINRAIGLAQALPPEFDLLGLDREAWSVEDVLTLGRLVSLDVTWFAWMGLLRGPAGMATTLWQRVTQLGQITGRMGSNSLAVGGSRSASGAAWLASDPHLGATLPCPWLLTGYRSPSFHAVGLMIPGVPMLALGRNPLIAWGGTNLHAASSDLVDVTGLPEDEVTVRPETILVRWRRPRTVALRETRYGPIISDSPLLSMKRTVALRWMGHETSDELTAMLRINRARSWQEFRTAAELFAVPGQNLLYADTGGHIGKLMAVRLPERAMIPSRPVVPSIDAGWSRLHTSSMLPASFDPDQGFIASANEPPDCMQMVIGYTFSPRTRFERLNELVTSAETICFATLRSAQLDNMVRPNLGFRDLLVRALRQHTPEAERLVALLVSWNGRYDADSSGALALELLVFHLLTALRGKSTAAAYSRTWDTRALAQADIEEADAGALRAALRRAVPATRRDLRRFTTWGEMHRISLPHVLAAIPVFGRRYRFGNWPVGGSNEALMKTGHSLTAAQPCSIRYRCGVPENTCRCRCGPRRCASAFRFAPSSVLDATPLLRAYADRRAAVLAGQNPEETQRAGLLRLVGRARDTRFGREHRFDSIRDVSDFQRQVPLRRYEDFWRDYWQPVFPHLRNISWPGTIPYFALTSGTTSGKTKYIPVSPEMNASNRRAVLDLFTWHLEACKESRLLGGRNFMLGGSTALKELGSGIWAGDLSGIAAREMPLWARPWNFPPPTLALLSDWEEKIDRLAHLSLAGDIRSLSGTPSWVLLFFDRLAALRPHWPARIGSWYPRFELFIHGGVDFAPYRRRFETIFAGSRTEMREVYPASEGFIAIADREYGEGLRMILDGGLFYEFVPLEEIDAPTPTRHWLATAEPEVNYALVLSSNAGLFGYVLGDTVRLISRRPPRVLVTGRLSYTLSAFGEHLIGEEIEQAVARAAEEIGTSVTDYIVGPMFPDASEQRGGHRYVVEFAVVPAGEEALARFAAMLDAGLSRHNADYRDHRAGDFGMKPPEVVVAPPGSFALWMRARGAMGGQHKVPRVSPDGALLGDVETFLKQGRPPSV